MNKVITTALFLASMSVALVGCDKPTVNVGAPAVAVPGPAGPAGATGDKGETGKAGTSSDTTTVIVTPEAPAK